MRIPGWAVLTCRIMALATVAGWLVAIAPAVASAGTCARPAQPPRVDDSNLTGIAVLSSCDAWAAGSYSNSAGRLRTLIAHWTGTSWPTLASPSPGTDAELRSVAAASPNDIWAAGFYYVGATQLTLIEHWNGTTWAQVASPNPGNSASDALFGVAVASRDSAWAVGDYYIGLFDRTLILHWNGTAWAQVTSPNPVHRTRYIELTSVAVVTGHTVRARSAAWAVGWYADGPVTRSLIVRWTGTAWTRVASPSAGPPATYTQLEGVVAVSPSRAWAVGYFGDAGEGVTPGSTGAAGPDRDASGTFDRILIERWNGHVWKRATVTNPGRRGSWLYGVTAASRSSAWAVGSYFAGSTQRTLVEHWNGTTWKQLASANPARPASEDVLAGVAGSSCSDIWAVGYSLTAPFLSIAVRC